jgi:hypothetical protein
MANQNQAENLFDRKTCVRGHPWNSVNVGLRTKGRRPYCRVCNAIRNAERRAGIPVEHGVSPTPWHQPKEFSETDWAYLAGLLDGEGCIGVHLRARQHRGSEQKNHAPSFRILLNVTNTNREVLDWLRSYLGGSVTQKTRETLRNRPAWVWRQQRTDAAQAILKKCLPYLKIKRQQAEIALKFPGCVKVNNWMSEASEIAELKRSLYLQTKHLNRRGSDALDSERCSPPHP